MWLALHHHQILTTPTPMTQSCDSQSLCAMTSHNTFYLPLVPCLHMPPPFFVSLPQTSNQLQACYHFFGFVHLHEVALGMPIVVSSLLFFVLLFLLDVVMVNNMLIIIHLLVYCFFVVGGVTHQCCVFFCDLKKRCNTTTLCYFLQHLIKCIMSSTPFNTTSYYSFLCVFLG